MPHVGAMGTADGPPADPAAGPTGGPPADQLAGAHGAPENGAREDTVLSDTAPSETAPKDGALKEGALKEGALKEGALKEGALTDTVLKNGAPGQGAPEQGTPRRALQPDDRDARDQSAPPAIRGALRTVPAVAVAVVGGLALAAAFPPAGVWPLAAAGPALLVVALWGRSLRGSFVVGLGFGLAFFVPLLSWLLNVAWYAWAALAVAEAVIFAAFAVGQRLMLRLPAWPVPVAAWWVGVEAFRDRWPYAFPWGRLAMSQAQAPTVHWVAYGGPQLLSFLLALAGAALAWLLLSARRAGRRAGRRLAAPALAFAAAAGACLAGALLPAGQSAGAPTAEVAAVQGNDPHAGSFSKQLRETTVTQNHAAATQQLAAQVKDGSRPAPDLVIWPENSTDIDPSLDPYIYATITGAVSAIDRPVLVGAVLQNPLRNAGQLWLPGRGPVAIYVKRQLVPFGEYIPFRGIISSFSSLPSLQPVNFTAGHQAVVFRIGKIRLGDVICYEVGFDNLVSSEVGAGANLLTEQTNDADFELDGQLGETLQQLAMARIRAVEFDRSMVVAGTTGVSAIIRPDGALVARSQPWQRALLEARLPLVSGTTLAQRLGEWPEIVLSALAFAALAWAVALQVAGSRRRAA
jgi:apolipoprotein N-acyltransferase